MKAHFERLFAYDDWANREELGRLRAITDPPSDALNLMGHIIAAEWLWLARLRRTESHLTVWPELDLHACVAEVEALRPAWIEALPSLLLDGTITYVNTKGESFQSRVDDVLSHVVIHGAYHRGQIATLLRRTGAEPAYTDFIHCTRQGFI